MAAFRRFPASTGAGSARLHYDLLPVAANGKFGNPWGTVTLGGGPPVDYEPVEFEVFPDSRVIKLRGNRMKTFFGPDGE